MRLVSRGLGLVECMIATLLFVSCATALLSVTYRWHAHVERATTYENLTDKQLWLAAKLDTINLPVYLTLTSEARALAEQALGQPVENVLVNARKVTTTPFSFQTTNLNESDYSTIEMSVQSGGKAPVRITVQVSRPRSFPLPDTIPLPVVP